MLESQRGREAGRDKSQVGELGAKANSIHSKETERRLQVVMQSGPRRKAGSRSYDQEDGVV